jgi:transposase InsO family protein
MLTDAEYKQWTTKLGLPEPTVELISRIRESEPSRNVGGGRKNVTGSYPSQKMKKSIQFESHKVELPVLYSNEHDKSVLEIYDQPPSMKLFFHSHKGKVISIYHTPDYFVIYSDKAGWQECKPEDELNKLSVEYPDRYVLIDREWHCPPGEEYARQFGLHYWIKSSRDINWILQRNMVFLEDYLMDTQTYIRPEVTDTILMHVQNNPGILLADLFKLPKVETSDIYHLLARRGIYMDLRQELLTDPKGTHVFTDEQTAIAYDALTRNINIPKFSDHAIEVAPGTNIIWDGNLWIIINIGKENISIKNSESGFFTELSKEQFYSFIIDNRIRGIEKDIVKQMDSLLTSRLAEASGDEIKEANYRYDIILPVLNGTKKFNDIHVPGVTTRTVRYWVNGYKEAEQQYGSGFIGLIPSISKKGNRESHLPEDTLAFINNFLDKNETVTNQSNRVLYGKLCTEGQEKGIILPNIKTFHRIIRERPKYDRLKKTQGSRVAYQNAEFFWELEMTTPRHGERPFEIAHIDHTQIDLETVHSETKKNLGRPWLSLLMDAYTRRVLAFYITFDAPSYRSNMMLVRECVRRFNRLPQTIVMDNGKDLKSTYFQSLLSYFHVTYKIRPPHKARFGSVGERLFGTTMTQLIHNLQGNTKIMINVRKVTKSVNPKNHAVWTLPELYKLHSEYFYDFYDYQEHSSLGESPREAFERGMIMSGTRNFRFIPFDENFYILTLPAAKKNNGTAIVDPQRGVKNNYFYYYCPEFQKPNVAGSRVQVRYDPWDISVLYCFVQGQWVKCYSQYYSTLKNKSENEMKIASQELLKQKQKYAAKAALTTKELADFIRSAEKTEEMLNQRLCDEEMVTQLYVINGGLDRGPQLVTKAEIDDDFDEVDEEELDFNMH